MYFKYSTLIAIVALLLSFNSSAQTVFEHYQDGKIYLKIRNESNAIVRSLDEVQANPIFKEMNYIFNRYEVTSLKRPFIQLKTPTFDRTYKLEFKDPENIHDLMRDLNALDYVEYAERVELLITTLTPNDPGVPQQYHLTNIQAFDAWDIHTGGNAVVAIVDDAVRITHVDLAPNVWVNTGEIANNGIDDDGNGYVDDINGYDAADNDGNPNPPASASDFSFSHGTHCAGIACGATNNGTGIASIGYNNKIMAVKCTSDGTSNTNAIEAGYEGVAYAIAAGADIISMSWGGPGSSNTAQNVFNTAHNNGITLVAASGNDNVSTQFYPAAYNFVISVASTNQSDQKSSFSNYGSWIDVSAPGSGIISTVATSTTSYQSYDGTSMACPMVAGLCGLLKSFDGSLTPDNIEFCITNSADNIDAQNPSYISQLGAGRINANVALQCTNPTNPPISDFTVDQQEELCIGTIVQFSDVSIFNPTSWSWSFPGGTPNSSTQQNPIVTYNTVGTYDVTLTVTNQYGNDTKTQSGYIVISLNGTEEFFLEDFENGGNGWSADNPDNAITWQISAVGGTEGANAASINNYNYNAPGQRDALISPVLDFSGRSNINMEFDYAHRRYSQNEADSMIVYISSDGGNTYTVLFAEAENGSGNFATNTTTQQNFIPSSIEDWCFGGEIGASCPSFDLTAYDGLSNILLKFENVNAYGNNTYLDNISLTSSCYIPPGPPTTDFTADITSGCEGTVVQYTDLSYGNPDPASWSWSFPGGTPSSSSAQNPVITYNTSGTFNVTLMTTNAGGSDTKTEAGYVVIDQNATHTFYLEDFEAATTDWTVNNPDNAIGFEKITVGGTQSGNSAYYINHYEYATLGQLDEMVSPILDFSGKENVSLDIDYAHAKYNNNYTDAFNIYISDNGGGSYIQVFTGSDDGSGNFSTREATTANFIPTLTSDWCYDGTYGASCINIDLSAYDNQSSIRIKLEAVNGYSNNLFLDNIQLSTTCQGSQVVAPTADFSVNTTEGCDPLSINLIDLSSGTPDAWSWTISGAENYTSSDQNPNFIFSTAGTYNVQLVATNSAGSNTSSQSNYITVYPTSEANFTSVDNNGTVNFTNTSVTTGSVTYNWNFGDGNSSGVQNPSHTYIQEGTYTVTFTITDDCGTDVFVQNIDIIIDTTVSPTASFSASNTSGCAPNSISFMDQSAGAPTSWSWVFSGPDNLNSSNQNPSITFTNPGSYNVSLTVTNVAGTNSTQENNYIVISPDSDANFNFNHNNGIVDYMNTSSTTGSVTYSWDFGDGDSSSDENPTHSYSTGGVYNVSLTIIDDCGTNVITQSVDVVITGIEDLEGINSWDIFPNPNNGLFNIAIQGKDVSNVQIDVLDLLGRTIINQTININPQTSNHELNITKYPKGTYIIRLHDENGQDIKKVVVY